MTTPPSPLDPLLREAHARGCHCMPVYDNDGGLVFTSRDDRCERFVAELGALATRPPEPTPPGGPTLTVEVSHANGHPLPPGTRISVNQSQLDEAFANAGAPPGGLREAREVAQEVVVAMTSKAMTGPRFPVAGWPGHSSIYVDAITAIIEADRATRLDLEDVRPRVRAAVLAANTTLGRADEITTSILETIRAHLGVGTSEADRLSRGTPK